jgi:hypothetical protein
MTIALAQAANSNVVDSSTTSITVTLPSVAAGSLCALWLKYEGAATTASLSDGLGSSVGQITVTAHANNDLNGQWLYILSSNGSGSTVTFTVTLGAAKAFKRLHVWNFSYTGSISLDVTEDGQDATPDGSPVTDPFSTTGTDEVVLAGYGEYTGDPFSSPTINGVAATGSRDNGAGTSWSWYRILSATFTNGTAAGTIAGGANWIVQAVGFKAAAGGNNTQTPGGFGLTASLGTPTFQKSSALSPSGFGLTASLGTPTVARTGTVLPSGFALAAALGTPTVVKGSTIAPSGFALTASIGTPGIGTSRIPTGFGLTASLGTFTIEVNTTLAVATSFGLTASVGSPSIVVGGPITPTGFGLTASLGAPTITRTGSVAPAGFGLVASLGTPSITKTSTAAPSGFGLTATLGTPSISATGNVTLNPTGYALAALLGAPSIVAGATATPSGFGLTASLGTPALRINATRTPIGFLLTASLGTPFINTPSSIVVGPRPHFLMARGTNTSLRRR